MKLDIPHRFTENLRQLEREHPVWTERAVLAANRDYADFLVALRRTPEDEVIRLGRKLPAHRLHFLALSLLHDDSRLRERAARILADRPRGCHFSLLYPYFSAFPEDETLRKALWRSLTKIKNPDPIGETERALLLNLLAADKPLDFAASQSVGRGLRVDEWLQRLHIPTDSEFSLLLLTRLADLNWGSRADETELAALHLPLQRLERLSLMRLLTSAIRNGRIGVAARLACTAIDRFGPPRLADGWEDIPLDIKEQARELQVNRQLAILGDQARRFHDYDDVRPYLEAVLVRGSTAFIVARDAVFAEPLTDDMDGAILDASVLRQLLVSGTGNSEPEFSLGLVRRRLSADREIRCDDLARQLAMHLDQPGWIMRIRRKLGTIWSRMLRRKP